MPSESVLVTSNVPTQVDQSMSLDPPMNNAGPISQNGHLPGDNSFFFSDPFLDFFEDNSLQLLPQLTDGFNADLSMVSHVPTTFYFLPLRRNEGLRAHVG